MFYYFCALITGAIWLNNCFTAKGEIRNHALINIDSCKEDNRPDIKDFSFMQVSKGAILVKYIGEDAVVAVPSCYQGGITWNIGREAFKKNNNIEKVILPEGVLEIDFSAFSECSLLTSIEAPSVEMVRVGSFEKSGIKHLLLTNAKDIGGHAFMGCSKLRNIELPNVESVDENAFWGSGIESISLPKAEKIASGAFVECQNLKNIDLPKVSYLGERAFISSAVTTVYLPEVSIIRRGTFVNCTALENVHLPKVTHIRAEAFRGSSIRRIELPNVKVIGQNAFGGCSFLESVTLPEIDSISILAFNNTVIKSIKIPARVIESGAFSGCKQLKKVRLPNIVKLEKGTFINCSQLQKVHLGNKLQRIEYGIFFCTTEKCNRQDFQLYIDAEAPPVFEMKDSKNPLGFSEEEISTLIIKVPPSSVKAYKNARGWQEYEHRIFEQ